MQLWGGFAERQLQKSLCSSSPTWQLCTVGTGSAAWGWAGAGLWPDQLHCVQGQWVPPQAAQLEKAEESLSSHSASEAVAKSEQGGKGEEDREKGGGGGFFSVLLW